MHRVPVVTAAAALLLTGISVPAVAAEGEELFISEYIEGTTNNKAIEVYNPTDATVDLAGYTVEMYFNGSATLGLSLSLSGSVAPGDVYVVAHASANATILAQADFTNSDGWFNGDDAVVLAKNGAAVDSLGQIGVDPGAEWGSGLASTSENTLRRLPDVCAGDPITNDTFDPAAQWAGFAFDTFGGLGAHTCGQVAPTDSDGDGVPDVDDQCPGFDDAADADVDGTPDGCETLCEAETSMIGSVQGPGAASPLAGQTARVEGVVVADYQAAGGLTGYFLQDAGDGAPATSDGIFIYAPGAAALDVSVGDVVNVAGVVSEAGGSLTQITAGDAEICASGAALPTHKSVTLPAGAEELEQIEGMYVTFPQGLAILESFQFGRYGTIDVGLGRQMQPTAVHEPGSPEAAALAVKNANERIGLDDGRGIQNPDPALHPNGSEFTLLNSFRGGDLLTNITGVIDHRLGGWVVQPTEGADFEVANARPEAPDVGGDITVASLNVQNYFTTLNSRGANTSEEFTRQESKIVSALAAIDADVVGLIEIENNGTAAAVLTAALNAEVGAGTYAHIETGVIGTDEIAAALIYKTAAVQPLGDEAILDSSVDPDFADTQNRPTLAQTFEQVGGSEPVTVVVNHLKSKGSACVGDPDLGDGAGNCNITRTKAAAAVAKWLATDPTAQGAGRELIIGDLNSYDKEDPIDALRNAGYADLLFMFQGENAYSYVLGGQLGYLDYALAGTDLVGDVTGAQVWPINADEPSVLDYNTNFKTASLIEALYAPDQFRSSDHDPVIVGLDLGNDPPTADAGGPYTVTEGGSVTLNGAGVDPEGTALTFDWDLDGNGSYETAGQNVTFAPVATAPATVTATVRVTDAAGMSATDQAAVAVTLPTPPAATPQPPVTTQPLVATTVKAKSYFGRYATRLSKAEKRSLRDLVAQIPAGAAVTAKATGMVRSEGFTKADERRALKRAKAVRSYLQKLGLTGDITVSNKGRTPSTTQRARRVNVTITYTR